MPQVQFIPGGGVDPKYAALAAGIQGATQAIGGGLANYAGLQYDAQQKQLEREHELKRDFADRIPQVAALLAKHPQMAPMLYKAMKPVYGDLVDAPEHTGLWNPQISMGPDDDDRRAINKDIADWGKGNVVWKETLLPEDKKTGNIVTTKTRTVDKQKLQSYLNVLVKRHGEDAREYIAQEAAKLSEDALAAAEQWAQSNVPPEERYEQQGAFQTPSNEMTAGGAPVAGGPLAGGMPAGAATDFPPLPEQPGVPGVNMSMADPTLRMITEQLARNAGIGPEAAPPGPPPNMPAPSIANAMAPQVAAPPRPQPAQYPLGVGYGSPAGEQFMSQQSQRAPAPPPPQPDMADRYAAEGAFATQPQGVSAQQALLSTGIPSQYLQMIPAPIQEQWAQYLISGQVTPVELRAVIMKHLAKATKGR